MSARQGNARIVASVDRVVIWTQESVDGRLESDGNWEAVIYIPRPDLHELILHTEDADPLFGRGLRKALDASEYGRSYEDHGFSDDYPHWVAHDERDYLLAEALRVRPSALKRAQKRMVWARWRNGVITLWPLKRRRGQFESRIGDPEVTVAYAASDEEIGRALKTALSMSG